jgi:antitoxin VapB
MTLTRVFKNGNSQAVRIPADLAFDRTDVEMEIERVGDELRIRPARRRLDDVLSSFARFSDDFMAEGRANNRESEREML